MWREGENDEQTNENSQVTRSLGGRFPTSFLVSNPAQLSFRRARCPETSFRTAAQSKLKEEQTMLGLRAHDLLLSRLPPHFTHSTISTRKAKSIKITSRTPAQTSIPPKTPAAASTAQLTVVPLAAPVAPVAAALAAEEALEARLSTPALHGRGISTLHG